jgi:hypothetical protein
LELEVEVTGESEAPTPTPTPLEKSNETQPTAKSNPTSGSEAVNHVQKKQKTTSNMWTHFKPIGEGEFFPLNHIKRPRMSCIYMKTRPEKLKHNGKKYYW